MSRLGVKLKTEHSVYSPSTMIWLKLWVLVGFLSMVSAKRYYNETLSLKPLPRNNLLASFQFHMESQPIEIGYFNASTDINVGEKHYTYFPRALGPILESTNTRELHLRFTQGWWDVESWGRLPHNGMQSGGTGVELWTVIEAPNLEAAKKSWFKLSKTLSGFFCASLNFIDDSITTFPRHATHHQTRFALSPENKLYYLRAALPSEPICTENLTPFLKLLPTRGKAGISSLLDGHKVFDSLWHGMSIDVTTTCDFQGCNLEMDQAVNAVVDITRSLRKEEEGGIPKPIPGDKLRCDETKLTTSWLCFPSNDRTDISWSLEKLYGRKISGPAFIDDPESTQIKIDIDPEYWKVQLSEEDDEKLLSWDVFGQNNTQISEYIEKDKVYDVHFESLDTRYTLPIETPPILVSRSLTGYSQDQGGFRTSFSNPTDKTIDFIYFESLPWFMRLYLNTLNVEVQNSTGSYQNTNSFYGILRKHQVTESAYIKDRYYKPAVDRLRPSQLEFSISLPPKLSLILTYQFDKSLLLYHEYPPDANHGFSIEPAVITILDEEQNATYEFRTTSLLLTLPTPDFSMPYNVIILTCTVMSLAFGSIFNLLTKKVITEAEFEKISSQSKISKIVAGFKAKIQMVKSLIGR